MPSITHSFYREDVAGAGPVVFLLRFEPGTVHCVAHDRGGGRVGPPGAYFECRSGGRPPVGPGSCVVSSDTEPVRSRPLKTLGLIFAEGEYRGGW